MIDIILHVLLGIKSSYDRNVADERGGLRTNDTLSKKMGAAHGSLI